MTRKRDASSSSDSSENEDFDVADSLLPGFDLDSNDNEFLSLPNSDSNNRVSRSTPLNKKFKSDRDNDFLGGDSEDDSNLKSFINSKKKTSSGGFQSMGLSPFLLKAIQRKGYRLPTPIQRKSIPLIVEGFDVVGMARTGSGKTAAFVIPLIEKLKTHSAKVGVRGIIFSPNRELAFQTAKVIQELSKGTDLRNCAIVGGESLEEQFNLLAGNPDIIIATPGRLLHLAIETDLDLKTVEYVVFDEADRLFELGFDVQLRELLSRLPSSRQTLLFSATLPKTLVEFTKAGLQDPTLIRLDADTKMSQDLELAFFQVKQNYKEACLLYLLREVIKCPLACDIKRPSFSKGGKDKKRKGFNDTIPLYHQQTIIFVSTKHHVEYITLLLKQAGYDVGSLYGSMDQIARQIQINNFRDQQVPLFVVTDVAARGIDIPILENVINYDFVDQSKVFVHRVGRVARAGKRGWAYSFITSDDLAYFYDLQLFLGRPLITPTQVSPEQYSDLDYTSNLVAGLLATDSGLSFDLEWFHTRLGEDSELPNLQKVSQNGTKMYRRSRRAVVAARESHQRAKELLRSDLLNHIHPLLANRVDPSEAARDDILKGISNFKPAETVFEVGNRGVKKASVGSTVMKQRRAVLDSTISDYHANLSNTQFPLDSVISAPKNDGMDTVELDSIFKTLPSRKPKVNRTTKRDDAHYISYEQKNAHTEKGYSVQGGSFAEQAQYATLDLTGDDRSTTILKQNQLRWDKKKKKFIRGDGAGSDNKKIIKTEAGNRIPATYKQGLMAAWQKKRGAQLPRAGENELSHSKQKLDEAKNKRRFKHHSKAENEPANHKGGRGKSELKSAVEIRKEREQKEKRRDRTGRHEHVMNAKKPSSAPHASRGKPKGKSKALPRGKPKPKGRKY